MPIGTMIKTTRLKTLFEKQVKVLLAQGFPDACGMDTPEFLRYVSPLEKQLPLKSRWNADGPDHTAVLIVIPAEFLLIPKQMRLLEINGKRGRASIDLRTHANRYDIARFPYLASEVDLGETRTGTHESCLKQLEEEHRYGLTAEEGIAYARACPNILDGRRTLYLFGAYGKMTRDDTVHWIPALYLGVGRDEGRPILSHSGAGVHDYNNDVVPSCGFRIA